MRRKEREVTEQTEISRIIQEAKSCHLAMFDGDYPYLVPLSYGYDFYDEDNLTLYFHSAIEGKKLDCLRKNNKIAFEITSYEQFADAPVASHTTMKYECVMGTGDVIFLTDLSDRQIALSRILEHYKGIKIKWANDEKLFSNVVCFKVKVKSLTAKVNR